MNIPIKVTTKENLNDLNVTNSGQVNLDLSTKGNIDLQINEREIAAAVDAVNTGTVAIDLVGGGGHCKVL